MRILVTIASYGVKNLAFLNEIIQVYRTMGFDMDFTVLSEAPKDLGPGVRVVVGLPAKNPWSLPFAHKAILAENVDRYDLFIYSEDDIEVSEVNVRAFLEATPALDPDEIAGFLRYEVTENGTKLLTDVHGAFHWKPESVKVRGPYTVAEFTNEHAGFYILTRAQLKRAILSGGFLRVPYEGRYGLPETAATDPYTCCGFRKVICISALEGFLIRHMSNLYVNRHGIGLSSFAEQVHTLMKVRDGTHPASTLCATEPKILQRDYSKSYYEKPIDEIMRLIPDQAKSLLSIGCGWGATEVELQRRGVRVTALPLDSIIGATAARNGIEVIYGGFAEGLRFLDSKRFECILMTNILHLLPDPFNAVEQCSRCLAPGGIFVISGPNFGRAPVLLKRSFRSLDYRKMGNFHQSGISLCGPQTLLRPLQNAGLRVTTVLWRHRADCGKTVGGLPILLRALTANDWVLQARL